MEPKRQRDERNLERSDHVKQREVKVIFISCHKIDFFHHAHFIYKIYLYINIY